jgi:hypothetical protein
MGNIDSRIENIAKEQIQNKGKFQLKPVPSAALLWVIQSFVIPVGGETF